MKNKYQKIILMVLSFYVGNLFAQQEGMQFGSFTLFPTLGLSYGYDDNVFYTNDDERKLSSHFTSFSPGLRLETEGDKTNFMAQYDYSKTSFNFDSKYSLMVL